MTGGTSGTPGANNNASYFASQAAASAEAAAQSAASVDTATVAETQAMIADYYGGE